MASVTDAADIDVEAREPNVSGDLIRRVRLFHGWTQDGLASLFNVSRRTIIRWEERGTYFSDPDLEPLIAAGRFWRQIHARFEAAARHRLTDDGVVELITEAEIGRLDPVTLATRGALAALDRKRHT
jgi:transcriptional regulator with XRE-family HTH domain